MGLSCDTRCERDVTCLLTVGRCAAVKVAVGDFCAILGFVDAI